MPGRFALDIETVSPSLEAYERPPDFGDPAHFELLAVVLGHEAPGGEREVTVLFRDGTTAESELDLVESAVRWLADRDGDTYLTYGGEHFDVPQLLGRTEAAVAASGAGEGPLRTLRRLLESELDHVDVQPAAWDAFGDYTSFEKACAAAGVETTPTRWDAFDHGVDLDDHRPPEDRGEPTVRNRDVPLLGERLLDLAAVDATDTVTFRALRDLLDHYARADVAPLFDLADARPFGERR